MIRYALLICTLLALSTIPIRPTPGAAQPAPAAQKQAQAKARTDALGDPLPAGAVARLGTTRFVVSSSLTSVMGGKAFLFRESGTELGSLDSLLGVLETGLGMAAESRYRLMDAQSGKALDTWRFTEKRVMIGHSTDARWALLDTLDTANLTGLFGKGKKAEPEKKDRPFTFTLYDLKLKKEVRKLEGIDEDTGLGGFFGGFPGISQRANFSPDGKWIVTQNMNRVRLWEAASGKQVWISPPLAKPEKGFGQRDSFQWLGFTADNAVLLSKANGAVSVVDPARKEIVRSFDTMQWTPDDDDYGMGLTLAPDGSAVLVGESKTGNIRVWDVKTGKERAALAGHKAVDAAVNEFSSFSLVFSGDGKTLVTHQQRYLGKGNEEQNCLVRDWPSGQVRRKVDLGRIAQTLLVTPRLFGSTDGKLLYALNGAPARLQRIDLEAGKLLPQPADGHDRSVNWVAATPDGSILSADQENTLRTWDPGTGRQTQVTRMDTLAENVGRFNLPGRMVPGLSPDGKRLALPKPDAKEPGLLILDRATGKTQVTIPLPVQGKGGFAARAQTMLFSPDGRLLIHSGPLPREKAAGKGSAGALVRVLDAQTGKAVKELAVYYKSGGGGFGDINSLLSGLRAPPFTLTFSRDGRTLLATAGDQVRAWDVKTWTERPGLPLSAYALAVSPETHMVACAEAKEITFWEFASRKVRAKIERKGTHLVYSPDGRFLACAVEGGTVQVRDMYRDQLAAEFSGHEGPITCLAFLPDGKRLVTGSADCTLLIWELPESALRKPQPGDLKDKEAAWNDLASPDAAKAFTAIRALIAAPDAGVPLLKSRLKPAAPADLELIGKHLAALDNPTFAIRQRALKELQAIGDQAEGPLHQFLKGDISEEARRRAEQVLAAIAAASDPVTAPERLREVRAVEVLERTGTPEARQVLQALANGAPGALLTTSAQAALKR